MTFTLVIKRKPLKYLENIDRKRKTRVSELFSTLKTDPVPFKSLDVVKLAGYENAYRIRAGNLRITYEVLWEKREIKIHFVGPRGKAY